MDERLRLANQLCFTIYNMNRVFNKFYTKALAEYNLTFPQYLVLMALWDQDHQELRELGETLHLSSNTLTPLVRRLEQAGWLIREKPDSDARRLVVSLTKLAQLQEPKIHERLGECFATTAVSPEEYIKVLELNQQVLDQFKNA